MRKQKLLILLAVAMVAMAGTSAFAEMLVYEPFDYPDAVLNGQGGAMGTTGFWTTADTGFSGGWWCHPEGDLTGQFDDIGDGFNMFDGTLENLPTSGGFAGSAGPVEQGGVWGTRDPTGSMDANIGLDPSVTATFQSGTTTWFSYVGAHADNRNQGSPTLMICTDPTVSGGRGLTMQNSGNGIGGVGGPPRFNLFDVYPHYFSGGVHHQTPGGYQDGVFGTHDGIVTRFDSTGTSNGVLDESGQPRTHTMQWQVSDDNGFGAANIIVGKIEWDADTGGEDIITVVSFLETDEISEAAFDALVAAVPALSSANWASNKPDLDQSQFDTLNISSTKFYVDEIRIATVFDEAVGLAKAARLPSNGERVSVGDVVMSWKNRDPIDPETSVYVDVYFGTDPCSLLPQIPTFPTSGQDVNSVTVNLTEAGTYYWQVKMYLNGEDVGDPCEIPVWRFVVPDRAPTVDITTLPMMTWIGKSVTLNADVTDDGLSAVVKTWTADPAFGTTFSPNANAEDPIVTLDPPARVVRAVQAESDDAEQYINTIANGASTAQGTMTSLTDGDLELGSDSGGLNWQVVAVQFDQLGIPQGAVITSAKLSLHVDDAAGVEYDNDSQDFTIYAEAAPDAAAFTADPNNITDRARTTASVGWTAPDALPYSNNVRIETPDLTSLIQEIVDQGDWSADNRLTLMVYPDVYLASPTGGTTPVQEIEFEAGPGGDAPILTVEYVSTEPSLGATTVTLTLTVDDAENTIIDTVEIDVYEDACAMARIGEGKAAANPTDLDGDCDTDIFDLAVMADKWLDDKSLTAPVAE